MQNGGADRDRTDDLVIANDALSQLSYGPVDEYFYVDGKRIASLHHEKNEKAQSPVFRPESRSFLNRNRLEDDRWIGAIETGLHFPKERKMIYKFLLTPVVIVMSTTMAHTMPLPPGGLQQQALPGNSQLHLIAERQYKRSKQRSNRRNTTKLSVARGGVRDTCPGVDKTCIKKLKASCDKAGGGLSTEPDGGVDCHVIGIHGQ